MLVELTGLGKAEVIEEIQLPYKPGLGLRELSLMLGPYHNGDEYETHFLQTIGSGNWYPSEYDEFRFKKTNNLLESLWFHIPEINLESEEYITVWKSGVPVKASLKLQTPKNSNPEPMTWRCLAAQGKYLFCLNELALEKTNNPVKVSLSGNFDLLFIEQKLCGWLLSEPINYLSTGWDEPYSAITSLELINFLDEYLKLITASNIEQIEEENPELLKSLLSLHNRLIKSPDSLNHNLIIANTIQNIVEQFYDYVI